MKTFLVLSIAVMLAGPSIAHAGTFANDLNSRLHYGRGYFAATHAARGSMQTRAISNATTGIQVLPSVFDPFHTNLVAAEWRPGFGCPTNAKIATPSIMSYTDAACITGDPLEHHNVGLAFTKTGPTNNFAAGQARLTMVSGLTLTEIGYDLRSGGHCGAGAPRFDVVTNDNADHFIGCNSPPPTILASSPAWERLRWTPAQAFPPITLPVSQIFIIFDEGQDTGPDFSGDVFIDNVDINGTMIGGAPGRS